jgi:hypothetical protein
VTARPARRLSDVNLYIFCTMSLAGRAVHPVLLITLALATSSCGAADGVTKVVSYEAGAPGIQAGYVGVTATASGLTVVNQTARPIYLMAANAETLALLDWLPCTGGAQCPALAQGQKREIPWASVVGYTASAKQYTLFWWNVTVQPDGTARAQNVHNVPITR